MITKFMVHGSSKCMIECTITYDKEEQVKFTYLFESGINVGHRDNFFTETIVIEVAVSEKDSLEHVSSTILQPPPPPPNPLRCKERGAASGYLRRAAADVTLKIIQ
ncbi:hypothetical protein EVAR_24019_1 [Eumeta japonica]|uniref:Uncharacterized protein n=1 Tax=Eumeta variegata TaxID=151549 RepID=A0A4C1W8S8_EUMVA|nr:hypothetical protein EVAR_24019_1 [Eumeta japonica]